MSHPLDDDGLVRPEGGGGVVTPGSPAQGLPRRRVRPRWSTPTLPPPGRNQRKTARWGESPHRSARRTSGDCGSGIRCQVSGIRETCSAGLQAREQIRDQGSGVAPVVLELLDGRCSDVACSPEETTMSPCVWRCCSPWRRSSSRATIRPQRRRPLPVCRSSVRRPQRATTTSQATPSRSRARRRSMPGQSSDFGVILVAESRVSKVSVAAARCSATPATAPPTALRSYQLWRVHTIWPFDNHEPRPRLYRDHRGARLTSSTKASRSRFKPIPQRGDFVVRFNGQQVHDACRT